MIRWVSIEFLLAAIVEKSEGAIIIHLLDRFLTKDMRYRITLEEVKVSTSTSPCLGFLIQMFAFLLNRNMYGFIVTYPRGLD